MSTPTALALQNKKSRVLKTLSQFLSPRERRGVRGEGLKGFKVLAPLILAVSLIAPTAHAVTNNTYTLNIPAQDLGSALKAFSAAANEQVLFSDAVVAGHTSPALQGEYTPESALAILLKNTDLKADRTKAGVLLIRPIKEAIRLSEETSLTKEGSEKYEFVNEKTVAIERPLVVGVKDAVAADSRSNKLRVAGAPAAAQEEGSETTATAESNSLPPQPSHNRESSRSGIPEVLVTGSRSRNLDIERSQDGVQPYVVFDREKIARSESLNLEDFLKANLPMNTSSSTSDQQTTGASVIQGQINLRGLGANQTLVLVDGRRVPSVATAAIGFQQANISGIPLSSIERIEVLPATASAIYGGGATGGVINIIRKRDYQGIEVQAKYGNTFSSDVDDIALNLNAGFNLNEGRTSFVLSATHSRAGTLLAAERDFAERSRALVITNRPTSVTNPSSLILSTTANLCSATQVTATFGQCNSTPLVLDNGVNTGSSLASVPSGYAGPTTDGGAALVTTAGNFNLSIPNDGQTLLRSPKRDSISGGLNKKIGEYFEFALDAMKSRSTYDLNSGSAAFSVFLPANSPDNPYRQPIQVTTPLPGVLRSARTDYDTKEISGSLIVRLPRNWSGIVDHGRSQTRYTYTQSSGTIVPNSNIGQLSPYVLTDLEISQPNLSSYVAVFPDTFGGPFTTHLRSTNVRASGPALTLGGNDLIITGAFERRYEYSDQAVRSSLSTTDVTIYPARSQDVNSYYFEARFPLVSAAQGIPLVEALDLQTSIRHDKYKTVSTVSSLSASSVASAPAATYYTNDLSSTDYLWGVRFAPVKDIAFRTSFGTGFLPAGLQQLTPIINTVRSTPVGVVDPSRGNSALAVPFTNIISGNPNLQPEESRSWSVGVILAPRFIDGLRLSVDYTYIKKQGEIIAANPQFILDNETIYSERVIRGAKNPADPASWAGPITQLDTSLINALFSSIRSTDLQLDYTWNWGGLGTFRHSTTATQARQFERQLVLNAASFDAVGNADGPLQWKFSTGLSWERGSWSAAWSANYYDSYLITSANPASALINPSRIALQGTAKIRSQLYQDIFVRYRSAAPRSSILGGTEISFGVQNVFKEIPPILASIDLNALSSTTYSTYGDPRLRRYSLSVQKSLGN